MPIRPLLVGLVYLSCIQQAWAQQTPVPRSQPDPRIVAQAYDRCMATQAVRLSRTSARDEDIHAQARQSCSVLEERLAVALRARLSATQAAEMIRSMEAQAKPNFMSLLARIRSDRARREPKVPAPAGPAGTAPDPTNPAQCEVALGVLSIAADAFSPTDASELRRRIALAEQKSATQFSAVEATAARKAVWPLLTDNSVLLKFAEACPK